MSGLSGLGSDGLPPYKRGNYEKAAEKREASNLLEEAGPASKVAAMQLAGEVKTSEDLSERQWNSLEGLPLEMLGHVCKFIPFQTVIAPAAEGEAARAEQNYCNMSLVSKRCQDKMIATTQHEVIVGINLIRGDKISDQDFENFKEKIRTLGSIKDMQEATTNLLLNSWDELPPLPKKLLGNAFIVSYKSAAQINQQFIEWKQKLANHFEVNEANTTSLNNFLKTLIDRGVFKKTHELIEPLYFFRDQALKTCIEYAFEHLPFDEFMRLEGHLKYFHEYGANDEKRETCNNYAKKCLAQDRLKDAVFFMKKYPYSKSSEEHKELKTVAEQLIKNHEVKAAMDLLVNGSGESFFVSIQFPDNAYLTEFFTEELGKKGFLNLEELLSYLPSKEELIFYRDQADKPLHARLVYLNGVMGVMIQSNSIEKAWDLLKNELEQEISTEGESSYRQRLWALSLQHFSNSENLEILLQFLQYFSEKARKETDREWAYQSLQVFQCQAEGKLDESLSLLRKIATEMAKKDDSYQIGEASQDHKEGIFSYGIIKQIMGLSEISGFKTAFNTVISSFPDMLEDVGMMGFTVLIINLLDQDAIELESIADFMRWMRDQDFRVPMNELFKMTLSVLSHKKDFLSIKKLRDIQREFSDEIKTSNDWILQLIDDIQIENPREMARKLVERAKSISESEIVGCQADSEYLLIVFKHIFEQLETLYGEEEAAQFLADLNNSESSKEAFKEVNRIIERIKEMSSFLKQRS